MGTSRQILLASSSPRRRGLLEAAGFDVEVVSPNIEEHWPGGRATDGAVELARQKLEAVGPGPRVTLAADTVVVLEDDVPLRTPADPAEARAIMDKLSGVAHRVVTGFCLALGDHRRLGAVTTRVTFRELSSAEIDQYIASREGFDKAGGYGIQGLGGALVDRVEGSYTNVVGLPLAEVISDVEALWEMSGG